MPSVRAATILLLIIAVLGLSAPARAFDQKTQWFTIMVKQASDFGATAVSHQHF